MKIILSNLGHQKREDKNDVDARLGIQRNQRMQSSKMMKKAKKKKR